MTMYYLRIGELRDNHFQFSVLKETEKVDRYKYVEFYKTLKLDGDYIPKMENWAIIHKLPNEFISNWLQDVYFLHDYENHVGYITEIAKQFENNSNPYRDFISYIENQKLEIDIEKIIHEKQLWNTPSNQIHFMFQHLAEILIEPNDSI